MSRAYEIIPARPAHLSAIARNLRAEEMAEIAAAGETPRHLLYRLWRGSFYRRAGIVGGDIAAVWGFGGSFLSYESDAWLFTSPVIDRVPLVFAREARAELANMLKTKALIYSAALESCSRSLRFWEMLGFTAETPTDIGNGAHFRRLVLRG